MSIKKFRCDEVQNDIDAAIEKGMKRYEEFEMKKKEKNKKKCLGLAAGIAVVMTLGISNPAMAKKIPFIGSAFEKLEEFNKGKDYEKYAMAVNQKVQSNGIGITVSEAVSDGIYLYLTYVIESDKAFSNKVLEEAKEWEYGKQVLINWNANVDFSDKSIDSSHNLVGKFIDENTFVGMEKYKLDDTKKEVPNEFILKKNITYVDIDGGELYNRKKGNWNFEIPIKVNKDLTKTIEVNKESNDYKINNIHVSPFEMIIEKSYLGMTDKLLPEQEKEGVWVYDEDGIELSHSVETATKIYLEAPKEESKSIRVLIKKPKPAKEIMDNNSQVTHYETQGFEEEPIMDIVIPLK